MEELEGGWKIRKESGRMSEGGRVEGREEERKCGRVEEQEGE